MARAAGARVEKRGALRADGAGVEALAHRLDEQRHRAELDDARALVGVGEGDAVEQQRRARHLVAARPLELRDELAEAAALARAAP